MGAYHLGVKAMVALTDSGVAIHTALDILQQRGLVAQGDIVVLTMGEPMRHVGGTNTLRIVRVGS
jgi:pyruvate kinase